MAKAIIHPIWSLIFLSFVFQPSICLPATIRVPTDYNTIQAAIDSAAEGDTVLVASGTYAGEGNKNLDFVGKAITVRSENGYSSTIIDCQYSGRGVYFRSGEQADSVLDGFTIQNGNVPNDSTYYGHGGGIFCYKSSPTISNCKISQCNADQFGGGISCRNASPAISNCIIESNTAPDSGGLQIQQNSSPLIQSTIISSNKAFDGGKGDGGGVGIYSSNPQIYYTTITHNESDWSGGGISIQENSSPLIANCVIENNTSKVMGGGILLSDSSGKLTNSTISSNILNDQLRRSSGGGICLINSQTLISSCTISLNDSNSTFPIPSPDVLTNSGGISFCNGSNGRLEDSTISYNSAQERGGIGSWNSAPTISNCVIENNKAVVGGGGGAGFYTDSAINSVVLTHSIVQNNTAAETGGGIAIWSEVPADANSSPQISYSTIANNSSDLTSGGINIFYSDVTIDNCDISGNSAANRAGVTVKSCSPVLVNTYIHNNVARSSFGAGISCTINGNAVITNCTVTDNKAETVGASLFTSDSSPVITNSVFWGNSPASPYFESSPPTIDYSDIQGGFTGGTGNIDSDPRFQQIDDYHLSSSSPCIDKGSNNAPNLPAYDYEGQPRIVAATKTRNALVDMGVDEYDPGPTSRSSPSGDTAWLLFLLDAIPEK